MRIRFLGTSHGVPEPGRRCACTMVEIGQKKYVFDMGLQLMEELMDLNIHPDEITAVFFTHMHGDHLDGLVNFTDLCSWYFKDADPDIYLPKLEAVPVLRDWLHVIGSSLREDIRFSQVEAGTFYDDGILKVTAIRTQHTESSYAFVLEAEGKTVVLTGDMKHQDGPVVEYPYFVPDRQADLVVCEAAHFSALLYEEAFRMNPPKKVFFTHYSKRYMAGILELTEHLKDTVPIIMAMDHMETEV